MMNQDNQYIEEEVITAGIEDIESMLLLNNKIYPKEWHVPATYIREIMLLNPEVYRVFKTSTGVKGMYGFLPLSKSDYTAVLEGRLEESEVGYFVVDYNTPKSVYLYLVTIIVDVEDNRRKEYASKIIKDIPFELTRLKEKGIDVKEIGAFAVSPEGGSVLPKIGFTHMREMVRVDEQEYPVFRAKVEDILEKIRV